VTSGDGSDDPRVASFADARRRKAEQDHALRGDSRSANREAIIQRIFGAAMIVMSIGFLVWLVGGFGDTPLRPDVVP
jgi:hypothetical protein